MQSPASFADLPDLPKESGNSALQDTWQGGCEDAATGPGKNVILSHNTVFSVTSHHSTCPTNCSNIS